MSELENKKTYGIVANPQNKKMISELEKRGEEVLVFPAIKAEKLKLTETARQTITNINDFDWIIFTDVYAADFFIEAMREYEIDFFELDNLTVCALGEAVADRLRFVQVHSDVIPSNLNDEAIFAAISSFAGGDLENLRFLIVGESAVMFSFIEMLESRAAVVSKLSVYQAQFADSANIKLKTLLRGGAVDEFVFSSAEDLMSLKLLYAGENLAEILFETKISAANEIAFQTLRENGFRPLYFHHK